MEAANVARLVVARALVVAAGRDQRSLWDLSYLV
jgi:hypothetical protein